MKNQLGYPASEPRLAPRTSQPSLAFPKRRQAAAGQNSGVRGLGTAFPSEPRLAVGVPTAAPWPTNNRPLPKKGKVVR